MGRPKQQHRTCRGRKLQATRGGQVQAGTIGHHKNGTGRLQRHLGGPQSIDQPTRIHEHACMPQARIEALPPSAAQAAQRTQQRARMRPRVTTHPQHAMRRRRLHDRTPRQVQGHGHGRKTKGRGIQRTEGLVHAVPGKIGALEGRPSDLHWTGISCRNRRWHTHAARGEHRVHLLLDGLHAWLHVWYPLGYCPGPIRQAVSRRKGGPHGLTAGARFSMRMHGRTA